MDLTGKKVFIRTVMQWYVGKVVSMDGQWIELKNASWVADSGRFSVALAEGPLDVVEPYPDWCFVAVGAITDISPWTHDLPTERKPQ